MELLLFLILYGPLLKCIESIQIKMQHNILEKKMFRAVTNKIRFLYYNSKNLSKCPKRSLYGFKSLEWVLWFTKAFAGALYSYVELTSLSVFTPINNWENDNTYRVLYESDYETKSPSSLDGVGFKIRLQWWLDL